MIRTLLVPLAALSLYACSGGRRQNEGPVVGAAKNEESSYFSKRASSDLVSELYADTLSRSEPLRTLDARLRNMDREAADSLDVYHTYRGYNTDYYNSAHQYATQVKDSVLRGRLLAVIGASHSAQERRTARHEALDNSIRNSGTAIGDLRLTMKVLLTLPLMERYQQQLPATAPLEGLDREWKALQRRLDSLRRASGG